MLSYVQIYSPFSTGVSYSGELVKRSNCNYEYWAVAPYSCMPGIHVASVHGIDYNGQIFVRNMPIQCVSSRPPPPRKLRPIIEHLTEF